LKIKSLSGKPNDGSDNLKGIEIRMSSIPKINVILFFLAAMMLINNSCRQSQDSIKLTTLSISGITQTSAFSGGNISQGKWDPVIDKGVCWGSRADPTLKDDKSSGGSGSSKFICSLNGLQPGTVYFVRAYMISSKDTLYGNNIVFSTEDFGTITDVDGNLYNDIKIGNQTWMAENLRTTKYNNGKEIQLVRKGVDWSALETPAYCWYKNEEVTFKPEYGALYNWFAVSSGLLCPDGWHVPDENEWMDLTLLLDGEKIAGGKLKQSGFDYWVEPNTGASNEYGFNALPGGFRYSDGKFYDFGFSGYWWSAGDHSKTKAYFRFIYYNESIIYRFSNDKKNGFSVRCLKNRI
jgi:uncharacterized protein (TIGR02145 family)